jgi:hypothetical protein
LCGLFASSNALPIRIATLFALAVCVLEAQTLWTPEHFWSQESAYAGARACAGCHTEIYRKQESSNHARSLRPVEEVDTLRERLPFEILDRTSGATLSLSRGGDGRLALSARKGPGEERMALEWSFGSGAKGITPVGRLAGGGFAESRVSWYASTGGFDFTTGATRFVPRTTVESLGRPLSQQEILECFGCHTTGVSRDDPAPARNNMGIRCERCHGPGAAHIRTISAGGGKNKQIFQPGRLDGFGQAQVCGVCHGRPPQDTDFHVIRFIQETPNTVRFPSQRLVLSRCFNETENGLRCSACHDPHTNVAASRASLEKSCVSCHTTGARPRVEVCPVAKQNCASCHMPKQRVMAHSTFTDHWIRVVRNPAAVE